MILEQRKEKKCATLERNEDRFLADDSSQQHHAEASIDGDGRGRDARGKKGKANQFDKKHDHDTVGGEWSECDARTGRTILVLKNVLVLSSRNGNASGEFAIDDETVTPKTTMHVVGFGWRKC